MRMHNPPHPGEILKSLCLEPLGLSVTERPALGVSRKTLSSIVNGRAGISPEMAVRLSIAFDTTRRVGSISKPSLISGMPSNRANSSGSRVLQHSDAQLVAQRGHPACGVAPRYEAAG